MGRTSGCERYRSDPCEASAISLVERGISSPTVRMVVKLARVLKVAPSKIMVRMELLMAGVKD